MVGRQTEGGSEVAPNSSILLTNDLQNTCLQLCVAIAVTHRARERESECEAPFVGNTL